MRRKQDIGDSQKNEVPHASTIFQWLPMPVASSPSHSPSPSHYPSHSSLLTHISPNHRGTAAEEARLFG